MSDIRACSLCHHHRKQGVVYLENNRTEFGPGVWAELEDPQTVPMANFDLKTSQAKRSCLL